MFKPSVCSGADQRKHQSPVSLPFVRGIHRWPVNSPHKGPVTRKMFPFDDVIMYIDITNAISSAHYIVLIYGGQFPPKYSQYTSHGSFVRAIYGKTFASVKSALYSFSVSAMLYAISCNIRPHVYKMIFTKRNKFYKELYITQRDTNKSRAWIFILRVPWPHGDARLTVPIAIISTIIKLSYGVSCRRKDVVAIPRREQTSRWPIQ